MGVSQGLVMRLTSGLIVGPMGETCLRHTATNQAVQPCRLHLHRISLRWVASSSLKVAEPRLLLWLLTSFEWEKRGLMLRRFPNPPEQNSFCSGSYGSPAGLENISNTCAK